MHDLPLHTNAPPVNDPDLRKPALNGLKQVLFHHVLNFPRLKRMQVNGILNRDFMHRSRI